MKYLKSTSKQLRELFEQIITVRSIAEPLTSFDAEFEAQRVLLIMVEHNFDVVGVRKDGHVIGYVQQNKLKEKDGSLWDCLTYFMDREVIEDTAPLLEVLRLLEKNDRVFVSVWGKVGGIVMRGDLQKLPVRMWIFSVISLLEMQLARLIRATYSQDLQDAELPTGRLKKANELHQQRQSRNEEIGLDECLQLSDRLLLVFRTPHLADQIGFAEGGLGGRDKFEEKFANPISRLRDCIAHLQDLMVEDWKTTINLVLFAEDILRKCEAIDFESVTA